MLLASQGWHGFLLCRSLLLLTLSLSLVQPSLLWERPAQGGEGVGRDLQLKPVGGGEEPGQLERDERRRIH